ncbi:hypothetical protein MMC13_006306 [Lambiella insularis]|nr:hypothetical protein [Lambiella insularis]
MSADNYILLDKGYTANVYRLPGTRKVCKSFLPDCADTHFPVEVKAYERFTARGHPATILKYYGADDYHPAGIVLELAENGNLYNYLWHNHSDSPPQPNTLYRWAHQATEALDYAHSCSIWHSDIHCVNFLLDENLDLKVADFAEASIDGQKSWSSYRTTHRLLDAERKGKTTLKSEIFGLGSALHYMVVGHDIFPELDYNGDEVEITRRLREEEFPDTSNFPVLGPVISKCWKLKYESMAEVIKDIDAEKLSTVGS